MRTKLFALLIAGLLGVIPQVSSAIIITGWNVTIDNSLGSVQVNDKVGIFEDGVFNDGQTVVIESSRYSPRRISTISISASRFSCGSRSSARIPPATSSLSMNILPIAPWWTGTISIWPLLPTSEIIRVLPPSVSTPAIFSRPASPAIRSSRSPAHSITASMRCRPKSTLKTVWCPPAASSSRV